MSRVAHGVLAILFAVAALLFGLAHCDRYWRWRDCFNELGRCYDPASEQVFLEQAGLVWGSFGVTCLAISVFFISRVLRRR